VLEPGLPGNTLLLALRGSAGDSNRTPNINKGDMIQERLVFLKKNFQLSPQHIETAKHRLLSLENCIKNLQLQTISNYDMELNG
jgi:hypothetical protein